MVRRKQQSPRSSHPGEKPSSPVAVRNGWAIYEHPRFYEQIEQLYGEVEQLKAKDAIGYKSKKEAKLLDAILKIELQIIPADPANPRFRLGKALGEYEDWQRAKFFDGRYRLFFRFSSVDKAIVVAWVNDEDSLRTYGSKTDAYHVFSGMLQSGDPPSEWSALLAQAKALKHRRGR
ncbi:toxin [Verrucomicrobia bacterium LW23]|nr:toxin [Verrucomicrobia bacterium LW23]